MIVYDKEQKEIVIPNGIGNINLYNNGVEAGYNQGYEQGQADLAAKSRVLDVTENGVYKSKFSDPIPPELVTGVYADGTEFYNYAQLNGKVFNTNITATSTTRLELWYKGDNEKTGDAWNIIIGAEKNPDYSGYQIRYYIYSNSDLIFELGRNSLQYSWDENAWHHILIAKETENASSMSLWVDEVKIGDFGNRPFNPQSPFYINCIESFTDLTRNANGYFGMIKIDDTIIIPTANGFLNTNTGELLEVVKGGSYVFTENLPTYAEGELYKTINVNVPDLNGSYDEGYAQGKTDGVNEQKGKLESINITENGTYTKEDGYNHIEVNVPDLNGSYDEGYNQGQADVAANARVLNVTKNGNYLSKFSDPVVPTLITGRYADGTDFYNYAELNGKVFNTNIPATTDSRIELWYKGDNTLSGDAYNAIIGANYKDYSGVFEIIYYIYSNSEVSGRIGSTYFNTNWDENIWHHIILSKNDGFVVDGVKIGDMQSASFTPSGNFLINANDYNSQRNANGYFGMIKIDDVVIIPTADGFQNVNTGELLEVVKDGSYTFTENLPTYGEGELYKTINVNVKPKINVKEAGLRFSHSTFTEVPEWADFEGITDMSNMFSECAKLQTIPLLNTSNVTNMSYMFHNCSNLQTIPLINTSKVTDMTYMFGYCSKLQTIPLLNTSNVTNMNYMFYNCSNLQSIPMIDTSNVTNMAYMFGRCSNLQTIPQLNTSKANNMSEMFSSCTSLVSLPALNVQNLYMQSFYGFFGYNELPKLTDFGGFLNLKCSLTNDNNLKKLPNLTYESCINILNGLYDFTGNGETPNGDQGQLKVHQNFLDKVGDEISIGTNKGWTITV